MPSNTPKGPKDPAQAQAPSAEIKRSEVGDLLKMTPEQDESGASAPEDLSQPKDSGMVESKETAIPESSEHGTEADKKTPGAVSVSLTQRRGVQSTLGEDPFRVIDGMTKGMPGLMESSFDVDARPQLIAEVFSILIKAVSADRSARKFSANKALASFRRTFIGRKFGTLSTREQLIIGMRYTEMLGNRDIYDVLVGLLGVEKLDLFPRTEPALLIALILMKVKKRPGTTPIYRLLKEVDEGLSPRAYNRLIECAKKLDDEVVGDLQDPSDGLAYLIALKLLNYRLVEESGDLILPSTHRVLENEEIEEEEQYLQGEAEASHIMHNNDDELLSTAISPVGLDLDAPQIAHPSRIFTEAEGVEEYLDTLFTHHQELYDPVIKELITKARWRKLKWSIQMPVGMPLKAYIDAVFSNFLGVEIDKLKLETQAYLNPAVALLTQSAAERRIGAGRASSTEPHSTAAKKDIPLADSSTPDKDSDDEREL